MTSTWKPEGYPTVSPYLIVEGAERVIDFMKDVLGAKELRRYDTPDGSIMHAEARIEDSVVMIGEAGGDWTSQPASLHVYVDDVDAVYGRALATGAESVEEPRHEEGDPDRRAGVRDPAGNVWWLATQVG